MGLDGRVPNYLIHRVSPDVPTLLFTSDIPFPANILSYQLCNVYFTERYSLS